MTVIKGELYPYYYCTEKKLCQTINAPLSHETPLQDNALA